MTYAKLRQDGTIEYPPRTYKDATRWIANLPDSPRFLKELGYLELHDGPHFQMIPDGKMEVPTYSLREPVGTTVTVPMVDDEGNPILDENGQTMSYEQTTYDIPEPYIQVTYVLQDMPIEEESI